MAEVSPPEAAFGVGSSLGCVRGQLHSHIPGAYASTPPLPRNIVSTRMNAGMAAASPVA